MVTLGTRKSFDANTPVARKSSSGAEHGFAAHPIAFCLAAWCASVHDKVQKGFSCGNGCAQRLPVCVVPALVIERGLRAIGGGWLYA